MTSLVKTDSLPQRWGRRLWLWLSICLALAALSYYGVVHVAPTELPVQFVAAQVPPGSLKTTFPILADAESFQDLAGDTAQTIVTKPGTSPAEALQQFHMGRGIPVGNRQELSDDPSGNSNSTLYVWFSYKTTGTDAVLLRYRSLSQLLTSVWVSDESEKQFQLLALEGPDAPDYSRYFPVNDPSHRLLPSTVLPASLNQPRQVLIRIDSAFPYWSNFSLSVSSAHERHRSERNYLDGIVLGALLASTAFAVYGLYFRQTVDYLAFLIATGAMCIWYLALGEHFYGGQWVPIRRLIYVGPVYIYFLLHGIGLYRLLYPKQGSGTLSTTGWRRLPLWLFLSYTGIGFGGALLYALLGIRVPFPGLFSALNEWLLVIAPVLLLAAVIVAPNRKFPAYRLLLLVEIVGALGSGLQYVHSSSALLDNRIVEILIQYPLPIEALIWAAALSAQFNYLEMLAKRRVKDALRKEAKKVRTAMQANLESREQALAALDSSYKALDQIRSSMLAIVDAHSHAAGNLLMRLGGHLGRMGRDSTSDLPKHIDAASRVLDDLATAVQKTERAVEDAQSTQHALAPASSLLRWQFDVIKARLLERGVMLDICIDPDCETLLVDGYHFMEVSRELLSNINRYAIHESVATIRVSRNSTYVTVCSTNMAVLRDDDLALRRGDPVSPAISTFTDEKSSGRGLATLGALLSGIGGTVKYDTREPSQVIVTVVLPLRLAENNLPAKEIFSQQK